MLDNIGQWLESQEDYETAVAVLAHSVEAVGIEKSLEVAEEAMGRIGITESEKLERCVDDVKGAESPWAVCRASLGEMAQRSLGDVSPDYAREIAEALAKEDDVYPFLEQDEVDSFLEQYK